MPANVTANMTAKSKSLNANQITNAILIGIGKQYPNVLAWRNNTGGGVGWSVVKAAIRMMKAGDVGGAIGILSRPLRFGLVGSSDIICVLGPTGRFVGIEVKDPETADEQSPIQGAFEKRCLTLGAGYYIAEAVDPALGELGMYVRGEK